MSQQYPPQYQQQYGNYPQPPQQPMYPPQDGFQKQSGPYGYPPQSGDNKQQQYGSTNPLGPNGGAPSGDSAGRLQPTSRYPDLWATILFAVHLLAFVVLSYFGLSHIAQGGLGSAQTNSSSSGNGSASGNNTSTPLSQTAKNGLIASLVVGAVVALGLSAAYTVLMRVSGRGLIKVSIIVTLLLNLAFTAFAFYLGAWLLAVINLIFLILSALFFFFARHRIPLAALIMESVVGITSRYPFTYTVAFLSLLVQFAYSVYWAFSSVGISSRFDGQGASQTVLLIFIVFSGYWVSQVLINTLHVTISGTVATAYFLEGSSMMPRNPTLQSAKRAFTTSLGPIAFGSLIIALIQTLRFMLRQAAQQNSILAAIADCIIGCLQGLIEYFNSYAYVHVAVYGKSFCEAAKDTWNLVKSHGIDAIVNDSLVGTVLGFGKIAVGMASGTVAYAVAYFAIRGTADWNDPNSAAFFFAILITVAVFLMGLVMMGIIAMVVESGTQTTFVILAEDPAAIQRSKPELYEKFKQVYPRIAWRV
ncbi:hypothetical protein MP228_010662 [Amoeboaphelidium protococcarum]|nr:hypothetical protein MP228_010662 [Amoeboaphelidium protococcarum]